MRILLVEDQVRLAEGLKLGLEAEGFGVDVVHDGTEGLWLAEENDYDAIILDIMLPGMNGYKVCRTLREDNRWMPILMFTAKDGDLDEAEALDTGADDFISKPSSYVVLLAHLRALIRRGAPERPAVLEVDDLRIDPATRTCRRGSTDIGLTPREFALLEYLARSAGRVVPRRELLDHVWDFARDIDSNVVDVYVGYLRHKVDLPFGRQSIETVRGVGYRLAPEHAS